MDRHRTPRPTSDLTTAAAELSAEQREVFGALQQFPQGAQVTELAKELGMHINTVRGHLDELIAHGLVVRRQARTTGRGRPSHIFTARVARNADVTSEYVELVDILATAIAGDDLERAREVGRQWAKEASSRHGGTPRDLDEATEKVARILRDMGFDPALRDDAATDTSRELSLKACPFVTDPGRAPSPAVCALHAGYVDGKAGRMQVELLPFDRPHECGARITEVE